MNRYHEEIYIPNKLIELSKMLVKRPKTFTYHAQTHFDDLDRSHKVSKNLVFAALNNLQKNPVKPFEIYEENGYVVKYCMRTKYNNNQDISFVMTSNHIVTFWLNSLGDKHFTLDHSLYVGNPNGR